MMKIMKIRIQYNNNSENTYTIMMKIHIRYDDNNEERRYVYNIMTMIVTTINSNTNMMIDDDDKYR